MLGRTSMRVLVAIAALLAAACARPGAPEALVCPAVAPYVVVREVTKEAPPRDCPLADRPIRFDEDTVGDIEIAIFSWLVATHRLERRGAVVCLAVPCNEAVPRAVLEGVARTGAKARDVAQCASEGVDGAFDRETRAPASKLRIQDLQLWGDDHAFAHVSYSTGPRSGAGVTVKLLRGPSGWIVEGVQTEWVS